MMELAPETAALLQRYELDARRLDELLGPYRGFDAVLLVGSVAEGLANDASDIDLLVVGEPELKGGERFNKDDGIASTCVNLPNRKLADVESLSRDAMQRLQDRFLRAVAMLDADRNPDAKEDSHVVNLEEREHLHRLRSGVCLVGHEMVAQWKKEARLHLLPAYNFHMAMSQVFASLEDVRAQDMDRDPHTSLLMIQEAAGHLTDAVLASEGETILRKKWRARLLRRVEDKIGAAAVHDLLDLMLTRVDADPRERLTKLNEVSGTLAGGIYGKRQDFAQYGMYWANRLGWARFAL